MPANIITINGEIEFTLSDSKMPALMAYLKHYSHEGMEAEGGGEGKKDTVFGALMGLMAKGEYGPQFQWDTCIIKRDDGAPGLDTVTFSTWTSSLHVSQNRRRWDGAESEEIES